MRGYSAATTYLELGSGNNNLPGMNKVRFFTAPDGTTVPSLRWFVDESGNFLPNGTVSIGSATAAVEAYTKRLLLSTNTIFVGFPNAYVYGAAVTSIPITGWANTPGYYYASNGPSTTRWQFDTSQIGRCTNVTVTANFLHTNATAYTYYCTLELVNTNQTITAINNVSVTGTAISSNLTQVRWTSSCLASNWLYGTLSIYGNGHASSASSVWVVNARLDFSVPP